MIPPTVARHELLSTEMPRLPDDFKRAGASYIVMAKICVASTGDVDSAQIISGPHPAIERGVLDVVRRWRFNPYRINGRPVPFCYVGRFEMSVSP